MGARSDSYAQLVGAFIGALHGPGVFPVAWREAVIRRLKADYGTDLEAECRLLSRLRELPQKRTLIAGP